MSDAIYSTLAYVLRYWFVLLFVLMLIGLVLVSVKEFKEKKLVLTEVGRYIGYFEVTEGPEEMMGTRIGLTEENTIGSGKNSDIYFGDRSVAKNHAVLYMRDDKMILQPTGNGLVRINGRRAEKPHAVKPGDTLSFGAIEVEIIRKERSAEDDD